MTGTSDTRVLTVLWLAVAMLGWAATAGAQTLTGSAGAARVGVSVEPDPPMLGENRFTITVTDRRGQPLDTAQVGVELVPPDGGPALEAEAVPINEPGHYLAVVDIPTRGRYQLNVPVQVGDEGGTARFRLITGNPLFQYDPRAVRAFWLGILGLLGLLAVIALVPWRALTRDRRAVISGVLLLIGVFLLARHAVKTFRRPGQMDVIEAQAMDMTAMRAPIGAVPVRVETVGYGDFEAGVSYTGTVVPFNEQAVRARVTGRVVDMPVYPGDVVQAGQVLARLDTDELGGRADEAVQEHLAAQDAAGAARAEARRMRSEVEQQRAAARAAGERVTQRREARDEAQASVERAQRQADSAAAMIAEARRKADAARAGVRRAEAETDEAGSAIDTAQAEQEAARTRIEQAEAQVAAERRGVTAAERTVDAAEAARERAQAMVTAARAGLPQAEAAVEAARADVAYEEEQLERYRALRVEGAISVEELQRQIAATENARAMLRRAQAEVAQQRGEIEAAEAMVRQSTAEIAAAEEQRARAQADVRAAQAEVARAEAEVASRGSMVGERQAGRRSRTAMADEAAEEVGMASAAVERAQADAAAAEAAVREARQRLAAQDAAIREAEADRAEAVSAIRTAQAGAEAADRRAQEAEQRATARRAAAFTAETVLDYTTLRAAIDGVVTERAISPPTLVQPGDVLLRVAQIDPVRVQVAVASTDAARIQPGAPIEVVATKEPGHVDQGQVTSVFPAADPTSRTTIVEAVLTNPDRFHVPGDSVTARIAVGAEEGEALSVPRAAVTTISADVGAVDGATRSAVWVVRGGGAATATEYYCTMHPEIVQDEPGDCPICKMDLTPRPAAGAAAGAADGGDAGVSEDVIEYYCTMHPEVVQDEPGDCPICKMELTPRPKAGATGGDGALRAYRVPVKLGRRNAGRVEVLDGLAAGDRVIVDGWEDLREGDRVELVTGEAGGVPPLGSVHLPPREGPELHGGH